MRFVFFLSNWLRLAWLKPLPEIVRGGLLWEALWQRWLRVCVNQVGPGSVQEDLVGPNIYQKVTRAIQNGESVFCLSVDLIDTASSGPTIDTYFVAEGGVLVEFRGLWLG